MLTSESLLPQIYNNHVVEVMYTQKGFETILRRHRVIYGYFD